MMRWTKQVPVAVCVCHPANYKGGWQLSLLLTMEGQATCNGRYVFPSWLCFLLYKRHWHEPYKTALVLRVCEWSSFWFRFIELPFYGPRLLCCINLFLFLLFQKCKGCCMEAKSYTRSSRAVTVDRQLVSWCHCGYWSQTPSFQNDSAQLEDLQNYFRVWVFAAQLIAFLSRKQRMLVLRSRSPLHTL